MDVVKHNRLGALFPGDMRKRRYFSSLQKTRRIIGEPPMAQSAATSHEARPGADRQRTLDPRM